MSFRTFGLLFGLTIASTLASCDDGSAPAKDALVAVPGADAGAVDGGNRCPAAVEGDLDALVLSGRRRGENASIRLGGEALPCEGATSLLALRVVSIACGTCRYGADHVSEVRAAFAAGTLEVFDVLLGDSENAPPTEAALLQWPSGADAVLVDPAARLERWLAPLPLPQWLVVDRRTFAVRGRFSAFDTGAAVAELRAIVDASSAPPPSEALTEGERAMLFAMGTPGESKPDPTNAHADDPLATTLGQVLFFDPELSPKNVGCASCHDVAKAYTDGRARSIGVSTGTRNALSLLFAAAEPSYFWDGRADTLWGQAAGPIENPSEMGSSRLRVVHRIADAHRTDYENVYGTLPDVSSLARFPADGKPGDPAWDTMAAEDRETVTAIFVRALKAIAAHERTIRARPARFDAFLAGEGAMTAEEQRGAQVFFRAGCASCHYGPTLSDGAFHVVGFPNADRADDGRASGLALLASAEFGASSRWSDAKAPARPETDRSFAKEAFRTPTLRALGRTGPFGHAGTFGTLGEVVDFYARGLPARAPGGARVEPWASPFSPADAQAVERFLAMFDTNAKEAPP